MLEQDINETIFQFIMYILLYTFKLALVLLLLLVWPVFIHHRIIMFVISVVQITFQLFNNMRCYSNSI